VLQNAMHRIVKVNKLTHAMLTFPFLLSLLKSVVLSESQKGCPHKQAETELASFLPF
jgi:hypothetical protein